jgi:hypothetical protein
MTRRSQGKARPSLPRPGELRAIETARDPSEGRAPGGRFAKGNAVSRDSGVKNITTRATSGDGLAPDEKLVARDTAKLLRAVLGELPTAGAIVRQLAYSFARESVIAALYDGMANRAELRTPDGKKLVELASFHRQRAERLSVTLLSESSAIHKARPVPPPQRSTASRPDVAPTRVEPLASDVYPPGEHNPLYDPPAGDDEPAPPLDDEDGPEPERAPPVEAETPPVQPIRVQPKPAPAPVIQTSSGWAHESQRVQPAPDPRAARERAEKARAGILADEQRRLARTRGE